MVTLRIAFIALVASCVVAHAQYSSNKQVNDEILKGIQDRERHNQQVLENRELARKQQLADEVTAVNDLVKWANDTVQTKLANSSIKCKSVVALYEDIVVGQLTVSEQQSPSKAGQQKITDLIGLLKATKTDDLACTKQILLSLGIDNHPTLLAAQTAKNIFADFTDTGLKQFSEKISLSFMENEDPNTSFKEMSCLVIKEWSWLPDYGDMDNGAHCHGRLEDLLRQALHGDHIPDPSGCSSGSVRTASGCVSEYTAASLDPRTSQWKCYDSRILMKNRENPNSDPVCRVKDK
jgi:sulfur relay (sulfurtransferase) DsrF/TusC family protein